MNDITQEQKEMIDKLLAAGAIVLEVDSWEKAKKENRISEIVWPSAEDEE